MKHFVLILNPTAGKGHAAQRKPEIEAFFNDNKLNYTTEVTEKPGHAIDLAKKYASQENTIIVAAGGDGTCNEIVNGMMLAKKDHPDLMPIMAVLAIGRGNDFAFSVGVPTELGADLDQLIHGKTHPMDVGEVKGGNYPQGRYFGNGIGVGFDAIVGFEAAKMNHVHGAAGYGIGAIKTLIKYPKAPEIEMTVDGKVIHEQPAMVSVMNGRRMGGAFFMAPDGKFDDGLFDYSMTRQGKRLKLLSGIVDYTKGTQARRDDTQTGSGKHIHIKALSGTLAVHADGETVCEAGKELDLVNYKHAILLLL